MPVDEQVWVHGGEYRSGCLPSETQIAEFLDADPPAAADAAVDVGARRGGIGLAFTDEDGQALQAYAVAVDATSKKREDASAA